MSSIILKPISWANAWTWVFTAEGYTMRKALHLEPIALSREQISHVIRMRHSRGRVSYCVFFSTRVLNYVVINVLPSGLEDLPMTERDHLKWMFVEWPKTELKYWYRSAVLWAFVGMFVILFALLLLRDALLQRVVTEGLWVNADCGVECSVLKVRHFTKDLIFGIMSLWFVAFPMFFYRSVKDKITAFWRIATLRAEIAILTACAAIWVVRFIGLIAHRN